MVYFLLVPQSAVLHSLVNKHDCDRFPRSCFKIRLVMNCLMQTATIGLCILPGFLLFSNSSVLPKLLETIGPGGC